MLSNPQETGSITYHFLSLAAHYFHTTDNWQSEIRHLLSKLNASAGSTNIFILQYAHGRIETGEKMHIINQWSNFDHAIEAKPLDLSQTLEASRWVGMVKEGNPVIWTGADPGNSEPHELQNAGLSAFIAFPVFVHNFFWGLFTMEYKEVPQPLNETESNIIESVSGLLGRAIEKDQIEQELRLDKSYYEELFHSSPAAIVILDQNGVVERVNREFTTLFQYKSEEITGKKLDDILPSDHDRERAFELTERILDGERVAVEGVRYKKDGTAVYVSIVGVQSLPNMAQPAVYSIYHDITERVIAQEKLKESQARFKILFESANDAIFLLKEGFVVECNARTLDIFRCTKEEIVGKSAIELSPPRQANGIPSLNLAVKYFRAAQGHEQQSFEWMHQRPDGSRFMAEVSINVFDWRGESFTQAIVRDITQRKQTEDLLTKRYEFIAFLSKVSADLINLETSHIDASVSEALAYSGAYTGCSRALVYLLNTEGVQLNLAYRWDFQNQTFPPILDQVLISDLPRIYDSILKGQVLIRQVPVSSVENEDILLEEIFDLSRFRSFLVVPLSVAGRCIGLTVYFSDKDKSAWQEDLVTPLKLTNQMVANAIERRRVELELKTAKEKAVESDKLKTAFLSSMSHEIRTPMNHILGFIELLKDPSLTEKERREFMAIVKSSGNLLLRLIDDIIDIAKLESGQLVINPVELQLDKFVDNVHFIFNEQLKGIGKGKIDFEVVKPKNPIVDTIKTDPLRLQQIVSNLLSNALKFTQEGKITFGFSLEPDHKLHFFVEDTGIGIPAEKHAEVFERFRQLDGSYAREYSGTGLGLAISKGLVELMNGEIGVESQPGRGSRFFFTIPFSPVHPVHIPAVVKPTPVSEHDFEGKTVLVVEDDEINYRFLEIVISRTKAKVIRALSGKDAIDFAMGNDIHLVLMDIQIPIIDGYVATREIKKGKPRLPIVAQTAHALAEERERCLQSGADDYLSKPINRKDLLNKMSTYLRKK